MVLKEAFRYQNVLSAWADQVGMILSDATNTTDTKRTYLFSKAKAGMEDVTEQISSRENVTELVEFAAEIIRERYHVALAIQVAKRTAAVDIDVETSANSYRRNLLYVLRRMTSIRGSEVMIRGGGSGYTFNNDMNQVEFKCDVTEVKTINFDRNKVRTLVKTLEAKVDSVSTKIDKALVNTIVDYEPVFDMNESLEDAFAAWLGKG